VLDPQQTITQAANGLGNSTSQLPTPPNEGLLLATSQPKFQVSGDRLDRSAPVCSSLRKKLPRVRRAYSLACEPTESIARLGTDEFLSQEIPAPPEIFATGVDVVDHAERQMGVEQLRNLRK
jgi:hypothetical protein